MPSPFPGMDPFIEGQRWASFHDRLIVGVGDALVPQVRPRYVVDVESVPMPYRERETFLTLRDRASKAVVTVIEVLSPRNKRSGSDGQREYLEKRNQVLLSSAHLVELDLLRGGQRLPTNEPLPPGDYYAFVCRAGQRPLAEVYQWALREGHPSLPIPLAGEDADVWLDLQTVFTTVYDRGGYDYALDYSAAIEPPLGEADAEWAREQLAAAAKVGSMGDGRTNAPDH